MHPSPSSGPPARQRWKLVLEYRGTDFVGWQLQAHGRSVQGVLEEVLASLLGHPVRVHGAGRTDAGVHALGQVCAFDTTAQRTARELTLGLNSRLPEDVACVLAAPVSADFDPRRWALGKRYRYAFLDRLPRSPLLADRAWHVRRPLDVGAMDAAARLLVGTHDLRTFRAAGCRSPTTVRTMAEACVRREGPLVAFEIEGHGFLQHMVRILAGTLHEVGTGRRDVAGFARALEAGRREAAGRTAPPHGLTLLWIAHGDGPTAWGEDDGDEDPDPSPAEDRD